jgi:hypothetical protein
MPLLLLINQKGSSMDRPAASRRVATLTVVALLIATLAACGSSGSPSTSASSSTEPNKEAMRAGLVQASDFPAGWQDAGKQKDSSDDDDATKRVAKTIPECDEFVEQADVEDKQTTLESDKFENAAEAAADPEQASSGSNEVVAYASAAAARTAYDVFAGATTTSCFQQLFDQLLERESAANLTPGEPTPTYTTTVERLGVPAAGDATTAYLVVVTIQVGDVQRQLGFVIQLVRVDQYMVNYSATLFQPVPDGFGANLVSGSIGRFEAALAKV